MQVYEPTDRDGVLYMLTGAKHGVQLVVSVYSLRRHYQGRVHFAVGDEEALEVVKCIAADERLGPLTFTAWSANRRANARERGLPRSSGPQYLNKTYMGELSPFDRTIFLDADTMVTGPLLAMWPNPKTEEVRLTAFADFTTTTQPVRHRVEDWREVARREVVRALAYGYPGINTGVLSFSARSVSFMKAWQEMTRRRVGFMCDELAAQLMFLDHAHIVMDDRWNWSPIHSKTPASEARIMHGHGWKFIKREEGRKHWWPVFEECRSQNIAGLSEWCPGADKKLGRVMEELQCSVPCS